jgi:hypothetical protein
MLAERNRKLIAEATLRMEAAKDAATQGEPSEALQERVKELEDTSAKERAAFEQENQKIKAELANALNLLRRV